MSNFLTNMADGDLNLTTGLLWLILATVVSMIGGAIGGIILAGKDIGYSFSAMLGALFAPAGAIPAILLGLILLTLLSNY
ncbi:hypothetical protein I8748_11135 [Nostoc sp. CENA67]|uniref:ABC transmembrane type-1 domain-containing protein n=1 Tax=Amazonocrinis nigriterrae CENA67 TaxID=2794033 RepID=A0A8J7L984_9NOST|nr:hypothetical protein [Amazonocrinis nigriterrae]MBH8562726.1 hypothetical protein [Amazonocrinis nigriterrae CENA67]